MAAVKTPNGSREKRTLSKTGEEDVIEVGKTLKGILKEFTDEDGLPVISIKLLCSSCEDEAKATADVMRRLLASPRMKMRQLRALGPTNFKPMGRTDLHRTLSAKVLRLLRWSQPGSAVLIVGHQPFLSWLSQELTGEALPISHGELLCITFSGNVRSRKGRLDWVLTPSASTPDDMQKIKEKSQIQDGDRKAFERFHYNGARDHSKFFF